MASTSNKQDIPELEKIIDEITMLEGLKIMNKNLEKIYELETKIYKETIQTTSEEKRKEIRLEDVDPTLKVTSQTEEYIYSTIIPGLITGRIIKQEFTHVRNE